MVIVMFLKIGLWPAAGLKILYVALGLKGLPTTGVVVHMPSFQLCRCTSKKRQNWYDLAAYTSEMIGSDQQPCTVVRVWLICSNRKVYHKKRSFGYHDTAQQSW